MSEQVPKWPDSLPLPAKVTFGPRRVHLLPADFESEGAISDILHDLYWFPDDHYYPRFQVITAIHLRGEQIISPPHK